MAFYGAFLFCIVVGGFILPSLAYGWQKNLNYWLEWINLVAGPALSTDDAGLIIHSMVSYFKL